MFWKVFVSANIKEVFGWHACPIIVGVRKVIFMGFFLIIYSNFKKKLENKELCNEIPN